MIRRLSPLAVDAVFVVALSLIAIIGFHATFAGPDYLIAGASGVVLGTLLAVLAVRLKQPLIVLAVVTVATFFLVGGAAALHGLGGLSWLPLPQTLADLLDGSVGGWKKLLTTLPPVDSGVLLVIPYLLGMVSGTAAMTLAARLKGALWPTPVPVALLISVILLGSQRPGQVTVNAAVFFVVLLGWVVVRVQRSGVRSTAGNQIRRGVIGIGLVGVAAGLAPLLGPHLPGVADSRYVWRSEIVPPHEVQAYPSPLASYRRYTPNYTAEHRTTGLAKSALFTVTGLPKDTFIRIATLDAYDGSVWRASTASDTVNGALDAFQRVGTTIGTDATGPASGPITVTVDPAYTDAGTSTRVWIPTAGQLTSLEFSKPSREVVADKVRYNLATGSAVLPGALEAGSTYTFRAVNVGERTLDATTISTMQAWRGSGTVDCPLAQCQTLATQLGGGSANPLRQILNIAGQLRGQYLTDGEHGQAATYMAGHSMYRLNSFAQIDKKLTVGDNEQYAALMALLANQLGVPARVVFGAVMPGDGVPVVGNQVQAWVEVRLADGSWAYLSKDTFTATNREIPPQNNPPDKTQSARQVPAPLPLRAPASATNPLDENAAAYTHPKNKGWWDGFLAVLWWITRNILLPVGLLLAFCGAIVYAKFRRGRRRRTTGDPAQQLVGGWHEYLDRARDHGHRPPPRSTRREQAAALDTAGGTALATVADTRIFGADEPAPEHAEQLWTQLEVQLAEMNAGLSRWRRLVVALNPISLIPPRWRDSAGAAITSTKRGRR